ncbi:hypothetical protein BLOT_006766 [Blomia tropicalis]|nr:hypothetical protein BLOT_006766 [Blomia tropicalis]
MIFILTSSSSLSSSSTGLSLAETVLPLSFSSVLCLALIPDRLHLHKFRLLKFKNIYETTHPNIRIYNVLQIIKITNQIRSIFLTICLLDFYISLLDSYLCSI